MRGRRRSAARRNLTPQTRRAAAAIGCSRAADRGTEAPREALGPKRSTILAYRSILRVHLEPVFAEVAIAVIIAADIERFMAWMRAENRSAKTQAFGAAGNNSGINPEPTETK